MLYVTVRNHSHFRSSLHPFLPIMWQMYLLSSSPATDLSICLGTPLSLSLSLSLSPSLIILIPKKIGFCPNIRIIEHEICLILYNIMTILNTFSEVSSLRISQHKSLFCINTHAASPIPSLPPFQNAPRPSLCSWLQLLSSDCLCRWLLPRAS